MSRAVWVDGMTARRFLALFNGIGPGSAVHRAADPEAWHWQTEHELLALVAELVDMGNRQFVRANSKEGATQPKPIVITRPGQVTRKQRGTTLDELMTMTGRA